MLTAHELLGFMSPALGQEILEEIHASDKQVYRAALAAVAEARKVRPIFLERKPRAERHKEMVETLSRPSLDMMALNVIQTWLLKNQTAMLADFLNALGIPHEKGAVEDLPKECPESRVQSPESPDSGLKSQDSGLLRDAVEGLLAKYPHETVAVYLRAFNDVNEAKWQNLASMLEADPRLQLGKS